MVHFYLLDVELTGSPYQTVIQFLGSYIYFIFLK